MTIQYQLRAIECREYDVNTGWLVADHADKVSQLFDSKDEAIGFEKEFTESLNISNYEVYQIELAKVNVEVDEDGEETVTIIDGETLNLIDNSESLNDYRYQVNQYYGQYMIGQNKYEIERVAPLFQTKNELLRSIEKSSFKWHPIEVFKTEEEVIEWAEGMNVVESVVELETKNK